MTTNIHDDGWIQVVGDEGRIYGLQGELIAEDDVPMAEDLGDDDIIAEDTGDYEPANGTGRERSQV